MSSGSKGALQAGSGETAAMLDEAYLEQQTFGDAALAQELLMLFEGQCEKLAPVIADTAEVLQVRCDAAHTLKGGARAIGAFAVADLAEMLEGKLRADGTTDEDRLAALHAAIARTRGVIAQARRG
jgi:HPt (histidine-containing phosphotransfer) domain-containing protein